MNFTFSIIKNMVILKLVTLIVPGVSALGFQALLSAAFVLWLLNRLVKPLLIVITLPINIVSLGIFTFFINGFIFYLIPKLVEGFAVSSFSKAVIGALVFSLIDVFINLFFKAGNLKVYFNTNVARPVPKPGDYNNVIDAEVVPQPKDTKQISGKP